LEVAVLELALKAQLALAAQILFSVLLLQLVEAALVLMVAAQLELWV